jgi:hypothetical protein
VTYKNDYYQDIDFRLRHFVEQINKIGNQAVNPAIKGEADQAVEHINNMRLLSNDHESQNSTITVYPQKTA